MYRINVDAKNRSIKKQCGNHNPSIFEIHAEIPELHIKVDGCSLGNPYAADLVLKRLQKESFIELIKYYPPQNYVLSKKMAKYYNLEANYFVVGNGHSDLIKETIKYYSPLKFLIPIPNFSAYHDLMNNMEYCLLFNNDMQIIKQALTDNTEINALVLSTPNNPVGYQFTKKQIKNLIQTTKLKLLIIDESFIDFGDAESLGVDIHNYNTKIVIIKSCSNVYGIAGLRLGYIYSNDFKFVQHLKKELFWSINNFASQFIFFLSDKDFTHKLQQAHEKYLSAITLFKQNIDILKYAQIYFSKGNFVLMKLNTEINPEHFLNYMIFTHNIYVRGCSDKRGLNKQYVRIGCGTPQDNKYVLNALRNYDHEEVYNNFV